MVNKKPVTAHIYEYTTQINISQSVKISGSEKGVPVQVIFCLKEKNQKKINSHRWFFNVRHSFPFRYDSADIWSRPSGPSFNPTFVSCST